MLGLGSICKSTAAKLEEWMFLDREKVLPSAMAASLGFIFLSLLWPPVTDRKKVTILLVPMYQ